MWPTPWGPTPSRLNFFFFKIFPEHVNIDMPWAVGMIETIKQPLGTPLMEYKISLPDWELKFILL